MKKICLLASIIILSCSSEKSDENKKIMENDKAAVEKTSPSWRLPTIEWEYTGGIDSFAVDAVENGGYFSVGWKGSSDAWLFSLDYNGNPGLDSTYGYSLEQIIKSSDNNLVMGGAGAPTSNPGFRILKTETDGDIIWDRPQPCNAYKCFSYDIVQTSTGYAMAGESWYYPPGISKGRFHLADPSGNYQIYNEYEPPPQYPQFQGTGELFSLAEATGGDFILAGSVHVGTIYGVEWHGWLIMTDSLGFPYSQVIFSEISEIWKVKKSSDGNFLIAGSKSPQIGQPRPWCAKIDPDADILWEISPGWGTAYDIVEMSNGGIACLAEVFTVDPAYKDYIVLTRTTSDGAILWQKTILDPASNVNLNPRSLIQTSDTGFLISGGKYVDQPDTDIYAYVVKLASEDAPNENPAPPQISGPSEVSGGYATEFTFASTDPEEDDIYFEIDWGDGNVETSETANSGESVTVEHTWLVAGNKTIKATAKDIYGGISTSTNHPITVINNYVLCGDANGDGGLTSSDIIFLVNYTFKSGPAPDPVHAGDANGSGIITSADVIYLVNYVFKGGPKPVPMPGKCYNN